MSEQPAWNPRASIAWRVAWHQAGYRRILGHMGEYHLSMVVLATELLMLSDADLRRRLWPVQ